MYPWLRVKVASVVVSYAQRRNEDEWINKITSMPARKESTWTEHSE